MIEIMDRAKCDRQVIMETRVCLDDSSPYFPRYRGDAEYCKVANLPVLFKEES